MRVIRRGVGARLLAVIGVIVADVPLSSFPATGENGPCYICTTAGGGPVCVAPDAGQQGYSDCSVTSEACYLWGEPCPIIDE